MARDRRLVHNEHSLNTSKPNAAPDICIFDHVQLTRRLSCRFGSHFFIEKVVTICCTDGW